MATSGDTILAWRVIRGMTQAQLANAARIPRPNLSAIEMGDREVTLRSLRAMALALGIRAGALVDGEMPAAGPPLTRATMERIAKAAAHGIRLADSRESMLVQWLRTALSRELPRDRMPTRRTRRLGIRETDRSYLLLKASLGRSALASLCERTRARLRRLRQAAE